MFEVQQKCELEIGNGKVTHHSCDVGGREWAFSSNPGLRVLRTFIAEPMIASRRFGCNSLSVPILLGFFGTEQSGEVLSVQVPRTIGPRISRIVTD
jgi:hypothetical protein